MVKGEVVSEEWLAGPDVEGEDYKDEKWTDGEGEIISAVGQLSYDLFSSVSCDLNVVLSLP